MPDAVAGKSLRVTMIICCGDIVSPIMPDAPAGKNQLAEKDEFEDVVLARTSLSRRTSSKL
eukprot:5129967-Prorocentrum_lima.AAC.1